MLALALPLAVPSLTEMSERNPVAILPADAPSSATAREITQTFREAGSENVLLVLLTNDKGLGPADEKVYGTLVDALRRDSTDVVMMQDFISTPELRQVLVSQDSKAWMLPVGLAGELGTPEAYAAYTRVSGIVDHAVAGTSLTANLTGPAGTVADLTVAGANDRLPIELAIAVLLLVILAIIYRSPATMMLPLAHDRGVAADGPGGGRRHLVVHRAGDLEPDDRVPERDDRRCGNGLRRLPDQPLSRLRPAR